MQGLLAGSIGVIEEFFGAELIADDSRRAHRASVITPARIAGLPWERHGALKSALMAHGERPVEDYRRALQSEPNGTRPTMLIGNEVTGVYDQYRTLEDGLRVVAYFGRVLVDDPLSSATSFEMYSYDLHEVLARLAEVRPLIAGGYITLFPRELAERLRTPIRPSQKRTPSEQPGWMTRGGVSSIASFVSTTTLAFMALWPNSARGKGPG